MIREFSAYLKEKAQEASASEVGFFIAFMAFVIAFWTLVMAVIVFNAAMYASGLW